MMPIVLDRNFNTSKVVNLQQDTKIANFSRKIVLSAVSQNKI